MVMCHVQEYKCKQQMVMSHKLCTKSIRDDCISLGHKQAQQKTVSPQLCAIL